MNQENKIVKVINKKIKMKESIAITKREDNQIIGSGYADSDGKEISADVDNQSGVKYKYTGKPVKSRENELKVANILINKMNTLNTNEYQYGNAKQIENENSIVDCIVYGIKNDELVLKIQIVHSNNDSKYWGNIARKGSLDSNTQINELCNQIIQAIKDKSKLYGTSDNIKDITLALDATHSPQHALDLIVDTLKNEFNYDLSVTGFKEIWIVGPNISMTNKIYPIDS